MDGRSFTEDGDGGNSDVLLVMTVEIGDGRASSIDVRVGDSPLELAEAFVRTHELSSSIIQPLAAHIEFNLQAIQSQQAAEAEAQPANTDKAARPKKKGKARLKPKSVEGLISRLYAKPMRAKKAATQAPRPNPELTLKPAINESSRRMTTGLPAKVHKRLYTRAVETRKKIEERRVQLQKLEQATIETTRIPISEVSRELSKHRFTKNKHVNYGAMLYEDGMKKKNELEELAKKEMEKKQYDPELTLRPKINPTSVRKDDPAWKRLSEHARKMRAHLDQQKKKEEHKELAGCTFRPEISRRSAKLMEERTSTISNGGASSHFDHLYEEAIKRRTRAAIYDQWLPPDVTFQPNIGKNARRPKNDSDDEAFVNRLAYSKLERDQILDELRERANQPIDQNTGQTLFHPRISRPPRFERPPGATVTEHLYAERHDFAKARQALQDTEEARLKAMRDKPATFSREVSKRLSEMRKRKRLAHIFSLLDVSKRGVLNLREGIDGSVLDPEVRADIWPLLKDASVMVDELTLDEFCALVDDYLRAQQNGPRSYLEGRAKKTPEPVEKKKVKARQGLVDELVQEAEQWAQRREERRKELDSIEMRECIFHPVLPRSSKCSPSASQSSLKMAASPNVSRTDSRSVTDRPAEREHTATKSGPSPLAPRFTQSESTRKSLAVINRLKQQYLSTEEESEPEKIALHHVPNRSRTPHEHLWSRRTKASSDDDGLSSDEEENDQRELRAIKRTVGLVAGRAASSPSGSGSDFDGKDAIRPRKGASKAWDSSDTE